RGTTVDLADDLPRDSLPLDLQLRRILERPLECACELVEVAGPVERVRCDQRAVVLAREVGAIARAKSRRSALREGDADRGPVVHERLEEDRAAAGDHAVDV